MGYAKRHDEFQTLIDRLNTLQMQMQSEVLLLISNPYR